MDNAALRYVFDRKKQADNEFNTGLLQIEVRESKSNKSSYISTGIKLFKNQFSTKNGFTCVKHNNAVAITAKGRRIYTEIEQFVLSDKCRTIHDAKKYNSKENSNEFIPFVIDSLSRKKIAFGTLKYHNTLIRRLKEFGKIVSFGDLTYENILLFDAFLKSMDNGSSTLNKRHSVLRQYIKEAVNMDYITADPYNKFRMPAKKSKDPVFLDEAEINRILKYTPEIAKLQQIKDLFVFQMFTGLAYSDLMNFTRGSVSEMEGYKVVRSNRIKTDESFISLFLPEAEKIADKYNYRLPKISNQKYNDFLKLLGVGANIKKNLTTHVARHTYATYLLNKGIPIETVSRAMGHSNIMQTQHYAKILGKKVIDDMKKLL